MSTAPDDVDRCPDSVAIQAREQRTGLPAAPGDSEAAPIGLAAAPVNGEAALIGLAAAGRHASILCCRAGGGSLLEFKSDLTCEAWFELPSFGKRPAGVAGSWTRYLRSADGRWPNFSQVRRMMVNGEQSLSGVQTHTTGNAVDLRVGWALRGIVAVAPKGRSEPRSRFIRRYNEFRCEDRGLMCKTMLW